MSSLAEFYANREEARWTPCKNLKKLTKGERVMVNWFPQGTMKPARVRSLIRGELIVELEHDKALLPITNASQLQWNENLHSKKK